MNLDDDRRRKMLLLNNSSMPLAQMLRDSAALRLDNLYYSAIPTQGAVTPSFTRATVKNIQNNDGYQVTLLAGELGFPGARRVYNLWGTASATLANGNNKSLTLPAGAYQFSMGAGTGTATFSGTGGATGTLDATVAGRVHVAKTITAGTLVITASVADLVDLQVVSMVAETDQTTIREYVSVGVESSPAYHGSMVDGVKCFPTDLSGNRLTGMTTPLIELAQTSDCLQSNAFTTTWALRATGSIAQNATGPNGVANSAWTITDSDAADYADYEQNIVIANDSATHAMAVFVKKTSGATTFPAIDMLLLGGTTVQAGCAINTNTGVVTAYSANAGTVAFSIESYNSTYWRVHAKAANNSTGNVQKRLRLFGAVNADASATWVTTTQGSAVFYGCMSVVGEKCGSYIATTTAAVTRNADQFLYTGALLGTLKSLAAVDFKRESGFTNAGYVFALTDGTANNTNQAYFNSATQFGMAGVTGGVVQWGGNCSNAYTPGALSSCADSVTTNDAKYAFDAVAQTPDVTVTAPVVNQLHIGSLNGTIQFNGYPGIPYGWVRQLSQSELNAVTA